MTAGITDLIAGATTGARSSGGRATISAGYPRTLVAFAASKGADRAALLARAGLAEDDLVHPDRRTPLEKYVALFPAAAEMTGDSAIALHFGQAVRMQDISIVGLICEACETTVEVARALHRYAALVVEDGRAEPAALMRGSFRDGGVWIDSAHDLFDHPDIAVAELSRLVWNARVMFRDDEAFAKLRYPRQVHFRHPAPPDADEYTRVFQAPVTFGAPRNAIEVDPEFLALRQPPVNRYVFAVLSERAEALLAELAAARTVRGRVEATLLPLLHTGEIGMDSVAARLGMSRQTLYRNLKAEGVTYERVLDDLRRRMALNFLSEKKVSVNETAYLVGFSEPAAFSRAFKRWTGKTPRTVLKG